MSARSSLRPSLRRRPLAVGAAALLAVGALVGAGSSALAQHGHHQAAVRVDHASGARVQQLLHGSYRADFSRLSPTGGRKTVKNLQPPAVSGHPMVGRQLVADPGTWSPGNPDVAYQWLADEKPIPGATGDAFTPGRAQLGDTITVEVTASKRGYRSGTADADEVGPVRPLTVIVLDRPDLPGKAQVGRRVVLGDGSWLPGRVSLAYQWVDASTGRTIRGATGDSFTPSARYTGDKLSVTVTATRRGYRPVTVTIAPTAPVRGPRHH